MNERPSVAWLGLGRMGEVMAGRLLDAGHELGVWNRTAARCEHLVERGATQLPGLAAARGYDVIFSMVLDDAALDALHAPEGGLLTGPGAARATVWVDGSTVSPAAAERAAGAAAGAGLAYVSAPVSGNPAVVASGAAIFALSGDAAGLDLAEQVCAELGRATYRVGHGPEANVVKLCTNALLGVTMQVLAEVNVLADRAGVSREALMAFVNDSAIGSPFSRYKTENLVGLGFAPTFTPEGQRKDLRLALQLADRVEVPMPVLSATEVAYSRLVASGLGEGKDFSALVLQAAQDAGHELQPEATS